MCCLLNCSGPMIITNPCLDLTSPSAGARPGPPPEELRVRGAAAAARLQNRPVRLGFPMRPAADHLRTVGEQQTEGRDGQRIGPATAQHFRCRVFIKTRDARPDAPGHEDLESCGIGRQPDDRDCGLLRRGEQQGVNRHDRRKLRLRRVPGPRHLTLQPRPRGR
jgi:hypothetical protein